MAGNYPAAVKELSRATALNPNVPSLQSFYGQALLATGDADGAATAFRKELTANPNDYDANFQLAAILSHRGQAAEARPLLARAAAVRPSSIEAREALQHGFHFSGRAPEGGVPPGAPAPGIDTLDLTRLAKPVVLVFGSYTCPKLRGSAEAINQLFARYRGRLDFRLVYIREAHAEDQWRSTINEREGIALAPARDLSEKQAHANLCLRKLNFPFPAIVDGMDTRAEAGYDAWPSRVYLVGRDGRVAFNSRLGELDFDAARLDTAIRATLAGGPGHESSPR